MKIVKLTCTKCDEVLMRHPTRNISEIEPLARYLLIKHKEEKHKMYCEKCNQEIELMRVDDFGEPIDWKTNWEQYLCEDCHNEIWDTLLDNACGVCETEPCKKGRECWVNPFPKIRYLCYVAPRKKQ